MSTSPTPAEVGYPLHIRNEVIGKEFVRVLPLSREDIISRLEPAVNDPPVEPDNLLDAAISAAFEIEPDRLTLRWVPRAGVDPIAAKLVMESYIEAIQEAGAQAAADPLPTDWHKRPPRTKGKCPFCGAPRRVRGEHRRIEDAGAMRPRFVKRQKSDQGWQYETIETRARSVNAKKKDRKSKPEKTTNGNMPRKKVRRPRLPTGPTDATQAKIVAVLRMYLFQGKDYKTIAKELGMADTGVNTIREDNLGMWNAVERQLAEEITAAVRARAGSDAVLADPDLHFRQAETAEKWLATRGEELFPARGKMTLCTFFETYYLPTCLADATARVVYVYRISLRKWKYFTGDPPLIEITQQVLVGFRNALAASRFSHGNAQVVPRSPVTCAGFRRFSTRLAPSGGTTATARDCWKSPLGFVRHGPRSGPSGSSTPRSSARCTTRLSE